MDKIEITVTSTPAPKDREAVVQGMLRYNEAMAGPENTQPVFVAVRNGHGEIVGGLIGYTHWTWLYVTYLWLAESVRGFGLGSKILLTAEHAARERGCKGVHLTTYDFQALDFYRKRGYQLFGTLDHYPGNGHRYFLWKTLAEA